MKSLFILTSTMIGLRMLSSVLDILMNCPSMTNL